MVTVKEWDRVAGWAVGVHARAWVEWDIEGWAAGAGVARGNSAIGNRAGSCMKQVKL